MRKIASITSVFIFILLALVSASVLAQGVVLTQPVQEEERTVLFPSTRLINQGRDVAGSACADCHGMDGISMVEGAPHLAGQRAVYLYRVQKAFLDGTRPDESNSHRGFMNEDAVRAVSAYYSSLATVARTGLPDLETQAEMLEGDPFMVIREPLKKCVKCHGETGEGGGSGMPILTSQHPDYFVTSMMGYLDGSRDHRLMKRLAGNLDEATLQDMGVFYAVQEPSRTRNPGDGDVNVGRRLAQECASCHGSDGNANNPSMPSLAGQDARYFVKAMKQYQDGKRRHQGMFEAVESLSEQELADLATFYATQEPVKRNVRAPLKSNEWIARCARCHGMDGNSNDPRFPMLAGQEVNYLKKKLRDYSMEERAATTMHAMADPLSAMDVERIANYFASQQPKAVVYIPVPCEDDG